ncbi:MAG TPA: DUF58 domain-containing protein [Gaiellaceae bacterium]|nr:DUF58 domain-containing protein [Gaiellaceae bacterium]
MTRRGSPRLGAYAGLSAFGLVAALVLGLPELVVLVAPFALLLGVGLVSAQAPDVELVGELERPRALEGDTVAYRLTVRAEDAVERLELFLSLAPGLESEPGTNPVALRLAAEEEREVELPVDCARWGGYLPGLVHLRARDRLGVFAFEDVRDLREPLRVYPAPERLLSLLRPRETQPYVGNQVARTKGDGIEFADIRPFVPGDRVRRVNWRASARRGSLVVNEAHPERNTDVILFLDTFSEARGTERGTLDLTVRAAAALAEAYLQRKDRVGVVGFGGVLSWLLPETGLKQLYRIVDALLETEIVLNYAWKDVDLLPPRTLPPQALVVGLTPLLDERSVGALLDLRARGFDLAIVEVSPAPFATPGGDESDRLAHRLWLHTRAALRHRFVAAGVPVVEWRDGEPLASPVEEVAAWRRQARVAHG